MLHDPRSVVPEHEIAYLGLRAVVINSPASFESGVSCPFRTGLCEKPLLRALPCEAVRWRGIVRVQCPFVSHVRQGAACTAS